LHVGVFKQDNGGEEDLIGSITVDLSDFIASGGARKGSFWFQLHNQNQPAGEIRLVLSFRNDGQPKPNLPTGDSGSKETESDPQLHTTDKNEGAADDEPDDLYANCPVEGCGETLLLTRLENHIKMHEEEQDSVDDQSSRSSKKLAARREQMRKQVLLKTFWEPEKGVKHCRSCGDLFSTFRRKHHCRTCGRIFDAKCLTETEGRPLFIEEKLAVCKTCLDIIQRGNDSEGKSQLQGDAGPLEQAKPKAPTGPNPWKEFDSNSPLYAPISAKISEYDFAENKFWFIIQAVLDDGRHWVLSRHYEDFYDFQIALLTNFPAEAGTAGTRKRTLPWMPGPVANVTDEITEGRRRNLNAYLKNLLEQPEYISRCSLVKQFFSPREGDYEIAMVQGEAGYEFGPEDLPGPMSNDETKLFMDTDVANPSPVEEVPYSEESTQYLIGLLQGFSLNESLALPHGFWPLLEKRIREILAGTEILPAYKDIIVKRTFGAAYTAFTEPGFIKRIDEERHVEDLVLTFNLNATKELQKGKALDDSSWKLLVRYHISLFVGLIRITLTEQGFEMNRSELVRRLAFLERKLLSNLQNLEADSESAAERSDIPSGDMSDPTLASRRNRTNRLSLSDISQLGGGSASGTHFREEEPQDSLPGQQKTVNQLADLRIPPSATEEIVQAAQDESSPSSTAKWKDNKRIPSRSPLGSLEGKLKIAEEQSKVYDDYHSFEAAHRPPMDGRDPTQPSSSRTNMLEGLQYRRVLENGLSSPCRPLAQKLIIASSQKTNI
jgi:hypothetical protein